MQQRGVLAVGSLTGLAHAAPITVHESPAARAARTASSSSASAAASPSRAAMIRRKCVAPPTNGCAQSSEPYFCDWVLGRLADLPALGATSQARQQALHLGGLVVRTTLQPATQAAAQAQAVGHIPADDPSGVRDALAVVQPGTGAVLAMAQDTAYGTGPGQTMVELRRRPGRRRLVRLPGWLDLQGVHARGRVHRRDPPRLDGRRATERFGLDGSTVRLLPTGRRTRVAPHELPRRP